MDNYGIIKNPEIDGSFKEFVIFTPTDGKEGTQFIADKWFENDDEIGCSTLDVSLNWTQDTQKLRIILEYTSNSNIISEPLFLVYNGKEIGEILNNQLSGELLKSDRGIKEQLQ